MELKNFNKKTYAHSQGIRGHAQEEADKVYSGPRAS